MGLRLVPSIIHTDWDGRLDSSELVLGEALADSLNCMVSVGEDLVVALEDSMPFIRWMLLVGWHPTWGVNRLLSALEEV